MSRSKLQCIILSAIILFNIILITENSTVLYNVAAAEPINIEGQTNYGGHWNVASYKYRGNQTIILDGNLTVEAGGKLVFSNVTLKLNCTDNGTYSIRIQDGGQFLINGNSLLASNTTDGKHRYLFWVESNGTLSIKNSRVEECGYTDETGYREKFRSDGLYSESSDITIENTDFNNCSFGLIIDNASYDSLSGLKTLKFFNCTNGLYFNASSGIVDKLEFYNCTTGIFFNYENNSAESILIANSSLNGIYSSGENTVVIRSEVRDSGTGIFLDNMHNIVDSCKFYNSFYGVYSTANDTRIRLSEFYNMTTAAFLIGDNATVVESTIFNTSSHAIYLSGRIARVYESAMDYVYNGIVYEGGKASGLNSSIEVNYTRIWHIENIAMLLNGSTAVVTNNSIHNGSTGVYIPRNDSKIIINNTYMDYCSDFGIKTISPNATITNSTVLYSGSGIAINANNSYFAYNTINNCTYAYNVSGSHIRILHNMMKGNNFSFAMFNNTYNITIFNNSIVETKNGSLIFNGTSPLRIIQNKFISNNHGIFINNSNYTSILQNEFTYNKEGLWIFSVNNSIIIGNIWLNNTNYSRINSTNLTKNFGGIRINNTGYVEFVNNTVAGNNESLFLNGSTSALIINNTFDSNGLGIWLNGTNNTEFYYNTIINNPFGLILAGYNTTLIGNTFNNTGFDLDLTGNNRSTTSIYHNNFYTCIITPGNASKWSLGYPEGGNYYDFADLVDLNCSPGQNVSGPDGLMDEPYSFNTTYNDSDPYPLAVPWPINRLPFADNLTFEVNATVKPMAVMFVANGSDIEDPESQLTPIFEYRAPNGSWENDSIDFVRYVNGTWRSNLTHPLNGSKGWYDIRIRFRDTGGYHSNVITIYQAFNITTEKPKALTFNISRLSVNRTHTINIQLNGTDPDESEFNLTPHLQVRHITIGSWVSSNFWDVHYVYANFSGNDTGNYTKGYWKLNFTPESELPSGDYEIRFRFNDTDYDFSDWLYYNQTINVVNNYPIFDTYSINTTSVIRTNPIMFTANASDIEDDLANLTCVMQYRSPTGTWTDVDNEVYNTTQNQWLGSLTPDATYELGEYDFRVEFRDLDNDTTDWNETDSAFSVLNNDPVLLKLNVTETEVYRTGFVHIHLDAVDIETTENLLIPVLSYRTPSAPLDQWTSITGYVYINGSFRFNLTIGKLFELGFYDFNASFMDNEPLPHMGFSNWIVQDNILEVLNNKPTVTGFSVSDKNIARGESSTVTFSGFDIEDNTMDLETEIEYKYSSSDSWITLGLAAYNPSSFDWSAEFSPSAGALLGWYDFRIRIIDTDLGTSLPGIENQAIFVTNNIPVIDGLIFSHTEINRLEILTVRLNSSDFEDLPTQYALKLLQMQEPGSAEWEEYTFDEFESGLLKTTIYFNETRTVGSYDFRAVVFDSNGNNSGWFEVLDAVTVLNRLPTLMDASVNPLNGTLTTVFNFTVNYIELESEDPESISLHIDTESYTPEKIDPSDKDPTDGIIYYYTTTLALGEYSFYFSASDKSGGYAESAVWTGLLVKNITKPKELGGIEGTVVDSQTAEGIPAATVYYSRDLSNFISITADSAGDFKIEELQPGRYNFYATASGYKLGSIMEIEVELEKISKVVISLEPEISPDAKKYKVNVVTSKLEVALLEDVVLEVEVEGPDGEPVGEEQGLVFNWDFGDGSETAQGQSQKHNYTSPGFYNITMTVFDEFGIIDIQRIMIKVNDTTYIPPDEPPDDIEEDDGTDKEGIELLDVLYGILATVVAIIIVLIFMIFIIIYQKKLELKEESEEEPLDEEKEKEEVEKIEKIEEDEKLEEGEETKIIEIEDEAEDEVKEEDMKEEVISDSGDVKLMIEEYKGKKE